jgi:molybdate transport system regulatory protein
VKLSARSLLRGKVGDVRKGDVAAQVPVDSGGGNSVTSTITADSANRVGLGRASP